MDPLPHDAGGPCVHHLLIEQCGPHLCLQQGLACSHCASVLEVLELAERHRAVELSAVVVAGKVFPQPLGRVGLACRSMVHLGNYSCCGSMVRQAGLWVLQVDSAHRPWMWCALASADLSEAHVRPHALPAAIDVPDLDLPIHAGRQQQVS